MFNKRNRCQFEAVVKLHSLISVPYVNAVTFAKLRLLSTRHSSQYSTRVEVRHHTVTWNTEHRFICKFRSNAETFVLEPNILKISIRMETKGGKSFHKVGFVSVDLACFTALGDVVSRRRYILQGYDEKHKRLDNSLLLVSFSMRQIFGDTCFRPPPENLSNCLIEPPDSDEGESLEAEPDRCPIDATTAVEPSVGTLRDSVSGTHANGHACDIDRIVTDAYASCQPVRSRPTQSPLLTSLSHCTDPVVRESGEDALQSLLSTPTDSTLTPNELAKLIGHVLPAQSTTLGDSTLHPVCPTSSFPTQDIPTQLDLSNNQTRQIPKTQRAPSCSVIPTDTTETQIHSTTQSPVSCGSPKPVSRSSDDLMGTTPILASSDVQEQTLEDSNPPLSLSSSSSTNPVSASTTSASTPTDSPLRCPTKNQLAVCAAEPKLHHSPSNPVKSACGDDALADLHVYDGSSMCHSLPHHASSRYHVDPIPFTRSQYPEHFATDSGLLLPSRRRRRKIRPTADFAFPPSHIGRPLDHLTPIVCTNPSLSPFVTNSFNTGGDLSRESHSSGYQSHSRQSSLESQTVCPNTTISSNQSNIVSDCPTDLSGPT